MPSFRRYERVPVWDEDTSDCSGSAPDTPQHLTLNQNSRESIGVSPSEERALLISASNQQSPVNTASAMPHSSNASGGAEYSASHSCNIPDDNGEYGPPKLDMSAPPPYSECEEGGASVRNVVLTIGRDDQDHDGAELVGVMLPSEDGMQPPSYEEVQRIKAVEAQLENGDHILLPPHTANLGLGLPLTGSISSSEAAADARGSEEDLLGTDLLFSLSFAAAFFFNWVGFVVLVCFCHSVAGRSGALAGFGLSLAKWAVIVRHSSVLAPQANTWLLWLIIVLGLAICMRAVLQYLNAKREWQHASAASRHRFLLFH